MVSTTRGAGNRRALPQHDALHAGPGVRAGIERQVLDRALPDREIGLGFERRLHACAVERAVLLRPGPAHRRPLAAIEHAELDSRHVGDAAHEPVERIHLAHERALGEAADGGIARHRADGFALLGDEQGCPRRRALPLPPASQPAWPPPITMTSKRSRPMAALPAVVSARLVQTAHPIGQTPPFVKPQAAVGRAYLPMQKSRKTRSRHRLHVDPPGDAAERAGREPELLGEPLIGGSGNGPRQRLPALDDGLPVPGAGENGPAARRETPRNLVRQRLEQAVNAGAGQARDPARQVGADGRGRRGREEVRLVQHRQRVVAEQRNALRIGLGPAPAVEDDQREVGARSAGERAAHAFALDFVAALAQAGGVGEGDRPARQVEADLDDVAGGAGAGRDDGRLPSGQAIEKAGFSGVRRAYDSDAKALAQALAPPGIVEMGCDLGLQRR